MTFSSDVEVFGYEYGSVTAFETSNGEMNLILICDSQVVFDVTFASIEYLCIPRASYCNSTSKAMIFRYMTTYNDSEERSHARRIHAHFSAEGVFTNINRAFASSFPSFVGNPAKDWQTIDFNAKDWNTIRSLR